MSSIKYLNEVGTQLLWNKVKAKYIAVLKANGVELTYTQDTNGFKVADITIPTATSDLTNDSNFVQDANYTHITVDSALSASSTNPVENQAINTALGNKADLASPALTGTPTAPTAAAGTNNTQIANTAFVTDAITTAIAGVAGVQFLIVQSLPASGAAGTIYLISNGGATGNSYDEYIWVNNSWEKIGTTDVDLSGYVQTSDLVAITSNEIDTICT